MHDLSPPPRPRPLGGPPGWFGKLPAVGDFVQRRLPADVVERWDGWLAQAVDDSRRALDADWLPRYLSAPIWAWAWSPGMVDAAWWFGVLMPSVDAVGRYFPLVVALDADGLPGDAAGWSALGRWYDAAAQAALAGLRDGITLDAFDQCVSSVGAWAVPGQLAGVVPPVCNAKGEWQFALPATQDDWPRLPAATLAALIALRGPCSLWWPLGDSSVDDAAARVTVVDALPAPARYADMLEGRL